MDFDTAMLLAIPASFLLFLGIEALVPSGRVMPNVRHWRLIGLACFAGTLVVYVGAPLLIVPLLPPMAIVDLERWGNWAALPVWDRLFGTYAAPVQRDVTLAFEPGRSRRWLAMLAMVDVNKTERVDGRIRL